MRAFASRLLPASLLSFSLLVSIAAHASVTQGKPNPDCPQFHPQALGAPMALDPKVVRRAFHVCKESYATFYDPARKTPLWVAHALDGGEQGTEAERTNDFRPDPEIPAAAQARNRDFERTGYDRGHMAPAQDFSNKGEQAMSQSFLLSNIIPQDADNNRHAWRAVESLGRKWATERGEVFVLTGPLFIPGAPDHGKTIGSSEVGVPTHIFKIYMDQRRGEILAFALPNQPIFPQGVSASNDRGARANQAWFEELSRYRVSLRQIEQWSGLELSSKADPAKQNYETVVGPMWSDTPRARRAPR